ncbi:MAG TPA: ferrous iron transport protein A [Phycisphaerales bacterium]|nr:ferrous iron transport protein A [Phycisphaerales bacterium]
MSSIKAVQSGSETGGGGRRVRLSQLERGQVAMLDASELDAESLASLRAMGLRPECELRVCKRGEPCIVAVCSGSAGGGCRIALAGRLADQLHVRSC